MRAVEEKCPVHKVFSVQYVCKQTVKSANKQMQIPSDWLPKCRPYLQHKDGRQPVAVCVLV